MSLKFFTFWVRNHKTGESAKFLGQGEGLEAAWKDANSNMREDFGKSSSGAPPIAIARLAVTLPDNKTVVHRRPANFESDRPFSEAEREDVPIASTSLPHAELVKQGKAKWAPEQKGNAPSAAPKHEQPAVEPNLL